MGVDNSTNIVLGSLRYKTSPNVDMYVNVPMEQTQKEIVEFDRTVDLDLQQLFVDERINSNIFRPVTKFSFIFKNSFSGSTSYAPFKNNLYYTNEIQNTINSTANPSLPWQGFPQYSEFDFIRTDNSNVGYTQPPNNQLTFVNKSASTYNWTHYLSYAYDNVYDRQMVAVDPQTSVSWSWVASDGLPFIIKVGSDNSGRVISFRCVMPHGLSRGEFVRLSFDYNGEYIFQVSSLGDVGFGSEEFIFNIANVGYVGTTFNQNVTGTFKRIISRGNANETTSEYYVRRNKILTNVEDSILLNAGFEQNIFNSKTKNEPAILTPNNLQRTSIKEGSQSYTLSFNKDIDINGLIDNQKRPLLELYFTTIWKGYFGWTNTLKQGYEFNLPLVNGTPSLWWNLNNVNSNANIPFGIYFSPAPLSQGPFIYQENLVKDDIIDGDYCEYNGYQQTERVISRFNHKFTFNSLFFTLDTNASQDNQFGYFYTPHNPIVIRRMSDYIEEGNAINVLGIPNYAYYSNLSNSFRWRDIYPYGFLDPDGIGVDYPFINGKHYPFVNTIFRLIPEGPVGVRTANQFINEIAEPIIDECE